MGCPSSDIGWGAPFSLGLPMNEKVLEDKLNTMQDDISEIKEYVVGKPGTPGMVTRIDRLEGSKAVTITVIGIVFTAVVGATVTAIGAILTR